jgi:hypothetical protein
LPERFPSQIIPIAYVFAMMSIANKLQGEAVNQHLAVGGRLGSWWAVVGAGLLCLAIIFGIFFAIAAATISAAPT